MNGKRFGEKLFLAWSTGTPSFEGEAGRARFLDGFAADRASSGRLHFALAAAVILACAAVGVASWRALSTLSFKTAAGERPARARLATAKADEPPLALSGG